MRWRRSPFRRGEVVEEVVAPPPVEPPPERELWPWLLALLILVLGGLAAAYVLSRDDDDRETVTVTETTGTTTDRRLTVPPPETTTETKTTTAREPKVEVPRVVGLREDAALARLRDADLGSIVRRVNAERSEGVVVRQRPRPEQKVDEKTRVLLEVSKGPPAAAVPNVVGVVEADAVERLHAADFDVIVYDVPSAEPKGTVVAQEPPAGEQAPRGSRVRINVSTGAEQGEEVERPPPTDVTVPNLVGAKRKAAAKTLRRAGLKPDTKYVPSTEPRDTVVAQSPKPGTTVKSGSGVRINISKGPNPKPDVAVRNVVGKDEQTATTELERAGFVVEVVEQAVDDPAQQGIVLEQSPLAGERAPRGAAITIVVGIPPAEG